jgi:hypothetical protein
MLIAAAGFTVALATTATTAAGVATEAVPARTVPAMLVSVAAAPDVPPALVTALLAETDAIWQGTGIQFWWQRGNQDQVARTNPTDPARCGPPHPRSRPLRVVIGHDTGPAGPNTNPRRLPLGWIVFDDPMTPEQEIYLSYDNAATLLDGSKGIVGTAKSMPPLQRDTLVARAMGRAFAHELGHYLSASKAHTEKGLMMAVLPAALLFGPDRGLLRLGPAEQRAMLARFTSIQEMRLAGSGGS